MARQEEVVGDPSHHILDLYIFKSTASTQFWLALTLTVFLSILLYRYFMKNCAKIPKACRGQRTANDEEKQIK